MLLKKTRPAGDKTAPDIVLKKKTFVNWWSKLEMFDLRQI
jgi:hypothetical protein